MFFFFLNKYLFPQFDIFISRAASIQHMVEAGT